jgi:hypothetical protein
MTQPPEKAAAAALVWTTCGGCGCCCWKPMLGRENKKPGARTGTGAGTGNRRMGWCRLRKIHFHVASAILHLRSAAQCFRAWSECRVQNHRSVDWSPNLQCFAYCWKYYSAWIAGPIRHLETQPLLFSSRWLVVDLMFHDDGAEYIIASVRAFNYTVGVLLS